MHNRTKEPLAPNLLSSESLETRGQLSIKELEDLFSMVDWKIVMLDKEIQLVFYLVIINSTVLMRLQCA